MPNFTYSENIRNLDLYQLVYISRITSVGLSGSSTLNDIANYAIKNNSNDNITGILCYGNGYFFQCVEGSEQALTNLKNKLLADNRHKDMELLDFSNIEARRFSSWSLRSIVLERWMLKDPRMKQFIPFKPYIWNQGAWSEFVNVLQNYYEKQMQQSEADTQPIKYNALGVTLGKAIGRHKAFLLIQTVLGGLIILALLWVLLSDKLF